jgi:hypothetical protein
VFERGVIRRMVRWGFIATRGNMIVSMLMLMGVITLMCMLTISLL